MTLRKLRWMILATCSLLGVLLFFPRPFLDVGSDEVAPADVIIVLGGEPNERSVLASKLYHEGKAPILLITGSGDISKYLARLHRAGIPDSVIHRETRSTSTFENALFCGPMLADLDVKTAILVTSWSHTRRALTTFATLNPSVSFQVIGAPYGWRGKFPFLKRTRYVFWEYRKIVWYCFRYGISPIAP